MNKKNIISILGCSFLVTTILLLSTNGNIAFSQQEQVQASQPHDSVTALMEGKTIPGRNFIHLYDSTPSSISSGHVAAHLPCDGGGEATVKVVGGIAPDVAPLNMTLVDQMSTLGNICMYHVDIPQQNGTSITDIALLNPAEQSIILPAATSVVIHVSQFAAAAAAGGEVHTAAGH
ncbi:MAG TPA: hypothetical protein VE573_04210 [Nitrososphaeraceae archaeon]|nr:hypothetical protein [Nitrososphaeraceae archaeon]